MPTPWTSWPVSSPMLTAQHDPPVVPDGSRRPARDHRCVSATPRSSSSGRDCRRMARRQADAGMRAAARQGESRHKACSDYVARQRSILPSPALDECRRRRHCMPGMAVQAPAGPLRRLAGVEPAGRRRLSLAPRPHPARSRPCRRRVVERSRPRPRNRDVIPASRQPSTARTFHAPLVIGADGHGSAVARALDSSVAVAAQTALAAHYRVTGLDRCGEMHVGRAYAGWRLRGRPVISPSSCPPTR